jgi:hypothetical protein
VIPGDPRIGGVFDHFDLQSPLRGGYDHTTGRDGKGSGRSRTLGRPVRRSGGGCGLLVRDEPGQGPGISGY